MSKLPEPGTIVYALTKQIWGKDLKPEFRHVVDVGTPGIVEEYDEYLHIGCVGVSFEMREGKTCYFSVLVCEISNTHPNHH